MENDKEFVNCIPYKFYSLSKLYKRYSAIFSVKFRMEEIILNKYVSYESTRATK